MIRHALACALILCPGLPAAASTEADWAAFRAAVEQACLAITEWPGSITVEVNPFGSESFGAAIVTAVSEGEGTARMICIYDKRTGTAELTAPF
jgi:hypothetical protein